ncbi:uncharacterized protein LOC119100884 [Pollicipes pollicipes]|uniref:uncharacterized protein LOC119100884 n=1 Tax=Pollicipes pollicipes TaxID=41117 RepID=UPI001884AC78|nr:uncharacterized protein LOC119100884 [Pollicipes pollicipes]
MRTLTLLSCLAVAGWARPQAPVARLGAPLAYSYSYSAPQQSRQEERDVLGNVHGSYSVRYSGGGQLTHTYSFPNRLPVFRTTQEGPLGPVGTLVSLRNPKDRVFLIEMLAQQQDTRAPSILTKTDAVLTNALPVFVNSKVSAALIDLRLESEAAGDVRQELQLRDPGDAIVVEAAPEPTAEDGSRTPVFVNSKESSALRVFRVQSLRDGLTGRAPPLVGPEEIIVEAASSS